MSEERGLCLPSVVRSIDVGDRHFGQFFFRDTFQAAHVDAVHLSHRCLISYTEGAHAALLAEKMLVLLRIEAVLRQLMLPGQQAKTAGLGYCGPEPVSPADAAVAPERRRRQVEISLEPDRAAMATPLVGLQHAFTFRAHCRSCFSRGGRRRERRRRP